MEKNNTISGVEVLMQLFKKLYRALSSEASSDNMYIIFLLLNGCLYMCMYITKFYNDKHQRTFKQQVTEGSEL